MLVKNRQKIKPYFTALPGGKMITFTHQGSIAMMTAAAHPINVHDIRRSAAATLPSQFMPSQNMYKARCVVNPKSKGSLRVVVAFLHSHAFVMVGEYFEKICLTALL